MKVGSIGWTDPEEIETKTGEGVDAGPRPIGACLLCPVCGALWFDEEEPESWNDCPHLLFVWGIEGDFQDFCAWDERRFLDAYVRAWHEANGEPVPGRRRPTEDEEHEALANPDQDVLEALPDHPELDRILVHDDVGFACGPCCTRTILGLRAEAKGGRGRKVKAKGEKVVGAKNGVVDPGSRRRLSRTSGAGRSSLIPDGRGCRVAIARDRSHRRRVRPDREDDADHR